MKAYQIVNRDTGISVGIPLESCEEALNEANRVWDETAPWNIYGIRQIELKTGNAYIPDSSLKSYFEVVK